MKSLFLLLILLLTLSCSTAFAVWSQRGPSQIVASERKVKVKEAKTIERDKSKPVRKAIED